MLVQRAEGQADGQTQPFADDGAFQKDALAVHGNLAGHDFVRQFFYAAIIASFVGQTRYFGKDFSTYIRHGRIDSSHGNAPYIYI